MKNKKRIFIYHYSMELGGIERSLIDLLKAIDYSKYDIDLFLVKHEGELFHEIPNEVNLLKEDAMSYAFGSPISTLFRNKHFIIGSIRLFAKLKSICLNIFGRSVSGEYISQITYPRIMRYFKKQEIDYNLAISFSWPAYYVLYNVKADKKVGWVHTDYTKIYPNRKKDFNMWELLDYVICVSEECKQTFLSIYPSLKDKVRVIENILNTSMVISKSRQQEVAFNTDKINIVSVGRYCYAKNFDNIPEICKYILEDGVDIKWYIIGYGADKELIKQRIKEFGMEEHVILLGKKENPFPYVKACDVYIQPSRFEGKAVAVREAQILGKPVIITNFQNAKSQLEHGVDGWIVPLENKSCAKGIVDFLNNQELIQCLKENIQKKDYSNHEQICKLHELMEE